LPLYVFCGRPPRPEMRWPGPSGRFGSLAAREDPCKDRIGLAGEKLMAWCEANGVEYLFGLAPNARLVCAITEDLAVGFKHRLRAAAPRPTPVISSDVPGCPPHLLL
jgi:hypothetical protein